MAAPNLASPTTITGKTVCQVLSATTETDILVNAASSGKAMRLTSLFIANIDGAVAYSATVKHYDAASGGNGCQIISTATVPADATLVPLGRDMSIWLEEDTRLVVQANAANKLVVTLAYEEVA